MRYAIEKKIKDNLELLRHLQLPQKYPIELFTRPEIFNTRREVITLQGFAVLEKDWLEVLANWIGKRKVLEVMSGCGALTKALQDFCIDIRGTDNFELKDKWQNIWCEIENIDAVNAIEKYKDRDLLIMSWAPYDKDIDYKCLEKMRQVNPNMKMLIIGEMYGATGSEKFWKEANILDEAIIDKLNNMYHRWMFIHDRFFLIN